MLFSNEDKLDQFDCEISNYVRELNDIKNKLDETKRKKEQYGFKYYNNKERRKEIINLAEKYGFSNKELAFLSKYVDMWNQDEIDLEVIDKFHNAEMFVKDNREEHKSNLFYKLSRLFNGENENDI